MTEAQETFISRSIRSFVKAIGLEMEAMKESLGSFEVPVHSGQNAVSENDRFVYRFTAARTDEKLNAGIECTLRGAASEALVTVVSASGAEVVLECRRKLNDFAGDCTLVIYPWFLYERLIQRLEMIPESGSLYPESALRVFGQIAPTITESTQSMHLPHLNSSQKEAVLLCTRSNLAFIWGPPGTGKTTTLAEIIHEVSATTKKILVVSTTNAAVDQVIEKIAQSERLSSLVDGGEIIRLGKAAESAEFATAEAVLRRRNAEIRDELREAERSVDLLDSKLKALAALSERLGINDTQLDLFAETAPVAVDLEAVVGLVDDKRLNVLLTGSGEEKVGILDAVKADLGAKLDELEDRTRALRAGITASTDALIERAHIVLSTMANVYVNLKLSGMTYDTVIIEEAGMAVLPAVFYCASLAAQNVILIGDPMQLPPIVQSGAEFVYRAMGRNIFSVAVPDMESNDAVAMLTVQYRMHPHIGKMVSDIFYDGCIIDDASVRQRSEIAEKEPFPGSAMVLVDTSGSSKCETAEGSYSRANEPHARTCVSIAEQAIESDLGSIAIITPYVAQSKRIQAMLDQRRIGRDQVECKTVHRFQGNERDLVILDTVDSGDYKPGVLLADGDDQSSSANLLNVSVSRAKGKLIIIADTEYFGEHQECSLISQILDRAGSIHHVKAQ